MPLNPFEPLNDLMKGYIILLGIAIIFAFGYFVGQTKTNDFWLSKGDYKCELIPKYDTK
jgi:hypothetical protein